jgi:hypothetical protein
MNSFADAQNLARHAEPAKRLTDQQPELIETMTMARFLTPDILTPGQYYDRVHRDDHETQAVKRLMLAVLSDAVRCFLAYAAARDRTGRLRFAEAEAWILDHKAEGPFAFVTICESLGIEPNCLREGIRQFGLLHADGSKLSRLGWRPPANRARPTVLSIRPRHRRCRTNKAGIELTSAIARHAADANAFDAPKDSALLSEERPPCNENCCAR